MGTQRGHLSICPDCGEVHYTSAHERQLDIKHVAHTRSGFSLTVQAKKKHQVIVVAACCAVVTVQTLSKYARSASVSVPALFRVDGGVPTKFVGFVHTP